MADVGGWESLVGRVCIGIPGGRGLAEVMVSLMDGVTDEFISL